MDPENSQVKHKILLCECFSYATSSALTKGSPSMSVVQAVPLPAWVSSHQTPETVDRAKLCFIMRLAALYHNDKGSVGRLALACGLAESTFHQAMKRGEIAPGHAVEIERLVGRPLFPRELFRPDLFTLPQE
jgi:hypothetical protein